MDWKLGEWEAEASRGTRLVQGRETELFLTSDSLRLVGSARVLVLSLQLLDLNSSVC